jgi:hypothetical protein
VSNLPRTLRKIAIAKSKEELVLKLIADEAAALEKLKDEARAKFKQRGMTDEEIREYIPDYPAGSFALDFPKIDPGP